MRAHQLVRGKVLLPAHWGLFTLAYHAWTEPIDRVLAAAACDAPPSRDRSLTGYYRTPSVLEGRVAACQDAVRKAAHCTKKTCPTEVGQAIHAQA